MYFYVRDQNQYQIDPFHLTSHCQKHALAHSVVRSQNIYITIPKIITSLFSVARRSSWKMSLHFCSVLSEKLFNFVEKFQSLQYWTKGCSAFGICHKISLHSLCNVSICENGASEKLLGLQRLYACDEVSRMVDWSAKFADYANLAFIITVRTIEYGIKLLSISNIGRLKRPLTKYVESFLRERALQINENSELEL